MIKEISLFDPLLLNPKEISKKMASYDFYPCEIMPDGFTTQEFGDYSNICAENCVNFQIRNNFRSIVIPTRFYEGLPDVFDLIDIQEMHFINPFLQSVEKMGSDKDVIIQLVLNSQMIKDKTYASHLLDWVTGLERIRGVYLLVELSSRENQVNDANFLFSMLKFIDALKENEMEVILGYLNAESLILSIADPSVMTIGSFSKTRIFRSKDYSDLDQTSESRGAKPRLYVPKLLDWIKFPYIELLCDRYRDYRDIVGRNKYSDKMFDPSYPMGPNKPESYKHYFIEHSNQLKGLNLYEGKERYENVREIINSAIQEYKWLDDEGIVFDDANGSHLNSWLTAANLYANDKGWR